MRALSIAWTLCSVCAWLCASAGCVVSTGSEGTDEQSDELLRVDAGPNCGEHTLLELDGVTCPSCREVVEANLIALEGVVAARVSLAPPIAEVQHCDTLDADDLVRAVRDAGYEASVEK